MYILENSLYICHTGSAAEVSFYKAYGTSVDYAIHNDVPEAYTFEVFGYNVIAKNDTCPIQAI